MDDTRPVEKLSLRELWSSKFFRVQVYLAVEVAIIVTPLAYVAGRKQDTPSTVVIAAPPVKSSYITEAKQ